MTQDSAAIAPTIAERPAQPYVATRHDVPGDIRKVVDVAFPALFGWLGEHGVQPSGAPLLRLLELDPAGEPLLIDVGAPIAGPLDTDGDVRVEMLPEGRYLTHLHVGPYRSETELDLGDARDAVTAWARDNGVVFTRPSDRGVALPCAYDSFRRGPVDTPDFMTWETELAYLVVEG